MRFRLLLTSVGCVVCSTKIASPPRTLERLGVGLKQSYDSPLPNIAANQASATPGLSNQLKKDLVLWPRDTNIEDSSSKKRRSGSPRLLFPGSENVAPEARPVTPVSAKTDEEFDSDSEDGEDQPDDSSRSSNKSASSSYSSSSSGSSSFGEDEEFDPAEDYFVNTVFYEGNQADGDKEVVDLWWDVVDHEEEDYDDEENEPDDEEGDAEEDEGKSEELEPTFVETLADDYGIERGNRVDNWYTVGSEIGAGGNSVIFNGLDIRTRQVVALKFNEPSDDEGSDDLGREYGLLQHLDDVEGVIRAYYLSDTMEDKYGSNDGIRYMVIERLQQGLEEVADLNSRNSRVAKTEFLKILGINAITILEQVHKHGVVHGDIHTGAFMFDDAGKLKLIDFGKGRMVDPTVEVVRKGVINQAGGWDGPDMLHLLSERELEGYLPTWKDDLLRLAETLYRTWHPSGFTRFRMNILSKFPADENAVSANGDMRLALIEAKRNLSWKFLTEHDFYELGPTCLDKFYTNLRSFPVSTLPDYDRLRSFFQACVLDQ